MKSDLILESHQKKHERLILWLHYLLKKLFLTVILIILIVPYTSGQSSSPDSYGLSINPKLGFYKSSLGNDGVAYGAEANYFKHKFLISVDYYRLEEVVVFSSPHEKNNHLGIMLGGYNDKGKFRFQYQAGLGLLWGITRTNDVIDDPPGWFNTQYESKDFLSFGFTPKLGFKTIESPYLSFGIDLQANINSEKSLFMPFLSIEIGILRSSK